MNVTTWEHQGICSSLESYGGPSNWVVLTFIPRLHCYCSIWHYHVSGTWTLSFTYLHTQQARRIEPHLWSHRPFVPHADNGKSRLDTGLWQGQRVVAAKDAGTPWTPGNYTYIWWYCCTFLQSFRYPIVCSKLTNPLAKLTTKHGRDVNVRKWICYLAHRTWYDHRSAVLTQDVRSTLGRTGASLLW